MTIGWDQKIY